MLAGRGVGWREGAHVQLALLSTAAKLWVSKLRKAVAAWGLYSCIVSFICGWQMSGTVYGVHKAGRLHMAEKSS